MRRGNSRLSSSALSTLVALLVLGCTGRAFADVGDAYKTAAAAASVRHPWVGRKPRVDGVDFTGGGLVQMVWERLAEPEERRYSIEIVRSRSIEETYERTTAIADYSLALPAPRDLREAISSAAFGDFSTSTLVATVTNTPLQLTQRFYRGKKWGYIVSRATALSQGVRTNMWMEIQLTELAERIRAATACAKTGECGE